ncbi:MAG TPA: hypothetical protein GX406_04775 [Pseudoclavibacter sp.]|nr:hypothetical protein [Pseudoclavibacter sp.]
MSTTVVTGTTIMGTGTGPRVTMGTTSTGITSTSIPALVDTLMGTTGPV